jgi:hypothetical protein
LPFVEPWVSSEDIAKGKRWGQELGRRLQACQYCVACITPGTEVEPWVNFEAGAIAKSLDAAHVSPILLGVEQSDLDGLPLAQFQCTKFSEREMLKLLRSINAAAGSPLADQDLIRNLRNTWTALFKRVERISLERVDEDEDDDEDDGVEVLDELEEDILVRMARLGDETADADSIARHIGATLVRTQYYLDRLVGMNYLYDRLNTRYPTEYGILPAGRAYVVENDLDS